MFDNKFPFLTIGLLLIVNLCFSQDTLSGTYKNLHIPSGKHIVKNVLTITDSLIIDPGANVTLIKNGRIICEGQVEIIGNNSSKIEIEGDKNTSGIGIVFKGISKHSLNLQYVQFKNLELPLSFEFGWFKQSVMIRNCDFIGNGGKNYLIQMLNPPFFKDFENSEITITIDNNIFAYNNAGIYIEDFVNDFYSFKMENNLFIGNRIYGNSYNITTNFIYGRKDIQYKKFDFKVVNNVFSDNHLLDVYEDTIIQKVNLGIYGSSDNLLVGNNYWGKMDVENIKKTLYDHNFNFNSPVLDIQPIVPMPNEQMPTFFYNAIANDSVTVSSESKLPLKFKKLKLFSNKAVNLKNASLHYIHFLSDSTFMEKDSILQFDFQQKNNEVNLSIQNSTHNGMGYYTLTDAKDINNRAIPNMQFGWKDFLSEKFKRKQIIASKLLELQRDSALIQNNDKIEYEKKEIIKDKTKFELSVLTGVALFNGTISDKKNIFNNDLNVYLGLNVAYKLNSILSLESCISKYALSNKDTRSKNNEQLARGMEFRTNVYGLSLGMNINFSNSNVRKFTNALNFGYEFMYFNPTGVYNGVIYDLQKLGTGGQLINNQSKSYSLITSGYYVGIATDYNVNKKYKIGVRISYHRPFTNYLDDVGADKYPTASEIMQSSINNKDAAIYFSNPTSRNTNGQYRNSPNSASDPFWILNLKFAMKF